METKLFDVIPTWTAKLATLSVITLAATLHIARAAATRLWKEDFESLPVGRVSRPANLNSHLFCETSPYGTVGLGIVTNNAYSGKCLRGNCHEGTDPITRAATDGRYILVRADLPAECNQFYLSMRWSLDPGVKWLNDENNEGRLKVAWRLGCMDSHLINRCLADNGQYWFPFSLVRSLPALASTS